MSHGVPYFVWRDGRPRWVPGSYVRAAGFKGRDLKDGKGKWLQLEAALDMARSLNIRANVTADFRGPSGVERPTHLPPHLRPSHQRIGPPRQGYVYFLVSGDQVKIGFSTNPFGRARALKTSIAHPISCLVAVQGDSDDERYLHWILRRHRLNGEWFRADAPVLERMQRTLIGRKIRE